MFMRYHSGGIGHKSTAKECAACSMIVIHSTRSHLQRKKNAKLKDDRMMEDDGEELEEGDEEGERQ